MSLIKAQTPQTPESFATLFRQAINNLRDQSPELDLVLRRLDGWMLD